MFNVILQKRIHGSMSALSSTDVTMLKRFTLPFPPYPHLEVSWRAAGEIYGDIIESVDFDLDTREFTCFTSNDREIYESISAQLHGSTTPIRKIEEIVSEYLEIGWAVDNKYGRGDKLDMSLMGGWHNDQ